MGLFHVGRRPDAGDYDSAYNHEDDRGGIEIRAGFYREGSFGLGAGRLRTVFQVVLPSAVPGILAGVILAVGRIVGETAALMYTAGTVAGIPANIMGSARTLSVHMYVLTNEGLYTNQSYATAVVLLGIVVLINALSGFIAKKITGKGIG